MTSELFVDAMDVLNQYAKIAFADITEFVEFGQEEVEVMTAFGPLMEEDPDTGEKVPVTKVVNTVKFKDSTLVDGQLISEVRQGRDGASIKLLDKMRALEKLEKYFDLIPDTWKRKIEEEKLALDRLKITGDGKGSDREAIDDFIKATTVPVDEVKDLFEDDEDEEN
jgi:phage terminase small subunit